MGSNFQQELEVAVEASEKAGKIMDLYQENGVEIKERKSSFNDIVTAGDRECQQKIVETVKDVFPKGEFLAEEDGLEPEGKSDRVWVIDPIDGTTNFQRGFPYFCSSIALKVNGEVKVGVVNSPSSGLNKLFYATKDGGAYLREGNSEREISVSSQHQLKGGTFQVEISEIDHGRLDLNFELVRKLASKDASIRRPGAAALDMCHVACGVFDGSLDYAFEWDFTAGKIIVEEAGGKTRLKQDAGDGLNEAVVSNGKLQEDLENILDSSKEKIGS